MVLKFFYNKNNEKLAESVQKYLNKNMNSDRNVKKIPTSTYMYDKLKTKGILVECGFYQIIWKEVSL